MGNYLTVAQFQAAKDKNGDTIDTSSYTDAELEVIISEAEELIERICHDQFYSSTDTYYFDGSGTNYLFMAPQVMYALLTPTTVTDVDFEDDLVTTYDLDEDYKNWGHFLEINADSTDVRRMVGSTGVWPVGEHNIKVVGTWGHTTTPVNITKATRLLCMEEVVPESTGMLGAGIRRKEWQDFEVEFADVDESVQMTGWDKVDRILGFFINHADLLTFGIYDGPDLNTRG